MDPTEAQYQRVAIDYQFDFSVGVTLGFSFKMGKGLAGIGLASSGMDAEIFKSAWLVDQDAHIALLTEFDRLMRPAMVANRLHLSPREKQCLSLTASGMSAKEIALQLGIAENTVSNILIRARESMQAGSTIEAIAKALAYDLI